MKRTLYEVTSVEAAKRLVSELLDAWNMHDVDRLVACHSRDYEGIDVNDPFPQRGHPGLRQAINRYLEAFPDLHFKEEATVFEANRIALLWTAEGTHSGSMLRIPPTGKRISVRGTSLLEIERGKVCRATYIWDVAAMLREIGLLPEL